MCSLISLALALGLPAALAAAPRPVAARAEPMGAGELATIHLFESTSPSVVYITTVTRRREAFTMNLLEIPRGTGSGFLWDEQGHVVTNFHVINGADGAKVTLSDQSRWDARLVGAAPNKDLAVLRITAPAEKLHPIAIGTSADLAVGQQAFAIGNPFGLDQTLTTGVISGLGREIKAITGRPIKGVIQTDAAINPGNSGGPLLDSAGRLIGVNTAIFSPSGAYAGVGFAVPVDTVNRIVPQLIDHGRVVRPGFGISIADDQVSRRLRLPGVLVLEVPPGSVAADAGLRATRFDRRGEVRLGDVITSVDGDRVRTSNDIYQALDDRKVGQRVEVVVDRGGRAVHLQVQLQALR